MNGKEKSYNRERNRGCNREWKSIFKGVEGK